MMRITNSDLAGVVARLNRLTHHRQNFSYVYDRDYGYQLVRERGQWTVSPRLGKRALFMWINAYIDGIDDGQKILMSGWECGWERVPEGGP